MSDQEQRTKSESSVFDIVAVGNAIVDIIARIDDDFVNKHQFTKGGMELIEEDRAAQLYEELPPTLESSGGSAANTIAGIASFGGKAAFIGKVKDDDFGRIFAHDLKALGVHYQTTKSKDGPSTARSLVAVTPDAERTMLTYLGATRGISAKDIDEELIANSKLTYLEGYLWDEPHAKEAMRQAVTYAKKYYRKVALSLSDPFCVTRHRDEFLELIAEGVDILFCNEQEAKELVQVDNLQQAAQEIGKLCELAAITLGSEGSLVISHQEEWRIPAAKDINVIDTTGAGDLYAAGFLYAFNQLMLPEECGHIATLAATEVVQHIGGRPERKLSELLKDESAA